MKAPDSREETKILTTDQRDRVFANLLHEETVFYNRLNIFLVCESLLFAGVVSSLGEEHLAGLLKVICGVGLALSFLWWCAQVDKLIFYRALIDRARETVPEFDDTIKITDERRKGWRRLLHTAGSSTVLANAFPLMFVGAWGYLMYHLQAAPPAPGSTTINAIVT